MRTAAEMMKKIILKAETSRVVQLHVFELSGKFESECERMRIFSSQTKSQWFSSIGLNFIYSLELLGIKFKSFRYIRYYSICHFMVWFYCNFVSSLWLDFVRMDSLHWSSEIGYLLNCVAQRNPLENDDPDTVVNSTQSVKCICCPWNCFHCRDRRSQRSIRKRAYERTKYSHSLVAVDANWMEKKQKRNFADLLNIKHRAYLPIWIEVNIADWVSFPKCSWNNNIFVKNVGWNRFEAFHNT